MDWGSRITYLASTAYKDRTTPFGIKDKDRMQHLCVMGRVGSGRAQLLARMALQDIERGIGILAIDVAGNLTPLIMERLSEDAQRRVIHLDPSDAEYPFSWNIVDDFKGSAVGRERFLEVLASIYRTKRNDLTDFIGKHILNSPTGTVLDLFTIVTDETVRGEMYKPESEEAEELATLLEENQDTVAAIAEHGRYLAKDTMVRNLIGQLEGKFSLSALADGAIIILDVSRIRIFPTRITPIVRLFTYAARAAATHHDRPVALFLHDCLRYFTESDAEHVFNDRTIALTLSDTIYHEGDTPLREKSLARCGSVITFQPHPLDVSLVEHSLYPYVTPEELSTLEDGEACVALTIDAVRTQPFFARALELPERANISLQDMFVESRQKYTTTRLKVDESFRKRALKELPPPDAPSGGGSSFSDAFRSIFANATKPREELGGTPNVPSTPPAPTPPMPRTPDEESQGKSDVSEDDLRNMLYVGPIPA